MCCYPESCHSFVFVVVVDDGVGPIDGGEVDAIVFQSLGES